MANQGKLKNHVVVNETITMGTGSQTRNEINIPAYGDIYAVELNISVLATGTLSSPVTLEKAITNLNMVDKQGRNILSNIRGQDLLMIERYRKIGRNRTIATTSGSAQTEQFFIPVNVELADQEAKVSVTIAPYSDMATSGATGGTVVYSIVVWYYTKTEGVASEKIERISLALGASANTFGEKIPRPRTINNILFSVGTESHISSITFSGDGSKEMDAVTPQMLTGLDNASLVDGHVTGTFSLYNSPFVSSSATRLDIQGDGTNTDTIQLILVSNLN